MTQSDKCLIMNGCL